MKSSDCVLENIFGGEGIATVTTQHKAGLLGYRAIKAVMLLKSKVCIACVKIRASYD